MRQPFWNKETLTERTERYKVSTEFGLRVAWENQYNQPSHGNPLFEDVPVAIHVLHLSAINEAQEAVDTPDDEFKNMVRSIEDGHDPFIDFRSKLEAFEQLTDTVDDEGFDDIDF